MLRIFRGRILLCGVFCFVFLTAAGGLQAQDDPASDRSKKLKYHSETSLSLVLVKGNNNSLSYSLDTEQNLEFLKNKISMAGKFISSRSNGEKTAEVYYGHLKYDRSIGTRAHLLGFMRYEQNKLAGYNFRIALSFGGG